MGSFSVSCGITRLTIGCGDRCVLLPLIAPKTYDEKCRAQRKDYIKISTTHLFLYNTDMWEPFCLPIEGIYDDYGSIEKIIKNKNTEIIENYFGLSIEDFVSLITDGRRDVYDRFSNFHKIFIKHPEDFEYDSDIETFFYNLGFVKENEFFTNNKCKIEILNNEYFKLYIDEIERVYRDYDKDDFLNDYFKFTREYLGIKENMLEKMLLINKIGGMFILKDVYDFYAKNNLSKDINIVNKFKFDVLFLKNIGFETEDRKIYTKKVNNKNITVNIKERYDKTINKRKFYDLEEFIKIYEEISGEKLDLSCYNGMDCFDWDELIHKNNEYHELKDYLKIRFMAYHEENIDLDNISEIADYILQNDKMMILFEPQTYLPYFFTTKNNETIINIYLKDVLKCTILKEFSEFKRLLKAMNLTNIMFIPSFAGTQCGCDDAEFKLSYITNKIVKERREELEYNLEDNYKEIDPNSGFNDIFY
jgi:hypothetical protein